MKKYLFIFSTFFITSATMAETFNALFYPDVISFDDEEIIVENNVKIAPVYNQDIKITNEETTVALHNNGTIGARIDANGHNLIVYNTGTILGGISTQNGGNVIQVINAQNEITNINVLGGNHTIHIENFQNVPFENIKDLNATSFEINNSSIVIDDFSAWQNWGQDVVLNGPVRLVINDINTVNSGEVINNIISGSNNLTVQVVNIDDLHVVQLTPSGEDVILNIEHEQNNDRALGNNNTSNDNTVGPLEQIRQNNPNDELVSALDSANNVSDVNNIKNNSYRFNHNILLRPIKVINNFSLANFSNHEKEMSSGLHVDYILSDTTNNFGGRIYIGNKFDDLYLNVGFNFNSFSYKDYLNDFSGNSYGLDIRAKQDFGDFWFDGLIGISLVQYDADYITSNDELKSDPFGATEYGKIDIGHNFNVLPDLILSPFVGITFQQYNVADVSDVDFNIRSGAGLKYKTNMDGIEYEYSLNGALAANGDLYSMIKIGFWSDMDKIGASLDAAMFKNDTDYHYKLSVNAKILF